MDYVDVFLQISCLRKCFTTRFTLVIFLAFMNCVNVFLQISCLKKLFTTGFTFVILLEFFELCWCVSSNVLPERMIYNKVLIFLAFMNCVVLLEKMTIHKIHTCDLFGLHEPLVCVSLNFLLQKMLSHKFYICNLFELHELCECVSSNLLLGSKLALKFKRSAFCSNTFEFFIVDLKYYWMLDLYYLNSNWNREIENYNFKTQKLVYRILSVTYSNYLTRSTRNEMKSLKHLL